MALGLLPVGKLTGQKRIDRKSAPVTDKKIVVVGGGTGNHTTLSGLKNEACTVTAVVAMSDDGGSSGRLRDELGQLPPGDVRQCLIALAADDRAGALMRQLFTYRFSAGNGLVGHNFGNLFLTALAEITGNTATAIEEASRILRIQGTVLPVTLTRSTLVAYLQDGSRLMGESNIDLRSDNLDVAIDYVYLEPKAFAYPPVLAAIEGADAIVMGPGDIYTSVLPNLLVDDVADAIRNSRAKKIYVCNLMTKRGESDGFKSSDFVRLIYEYLGTTVPLDFVVVNNAPFPERTLRKYIASGQYSVEIDLEETQTMVSHIVQAPLVSAGIYLRHDPTLLAKTIMSLVSQAKPARSRVVPGGMPAP